MSIYLPFLTFHLKPLANSSHPQQMLFQVIELWPTGACRKLLSLKYLPLRVLAITIFGFLRILQFCLANIAGLKVVNSLKSSFSASLLRHIAPLHPMSLILIAHWSPLVYILYIEMAWATNLMGTSFPPLEKNFSFQPYSILHTLSLILLKTLPLLHPTREGISRYWPRDSTFLSPKYSLRGPYFGCLHSC